MAPRYFFFKICDTSAPTALERKPLSQSLLVEKDLGSRDTIAQFIGDLVNPCLHLLLSRLCSSFGKKETVQMKSN